MGDKESKLIVRLTVAVRAWLCGLVQQHAANNKELVGARGRGRRGEAGFRVPRLCRAEFLGSSVEPRVRECRNDRSAEHTT